MLYLKGPNEFTLGSSPFLAAHGKGVLELKPVVKKETESIPENSRFNPVNSIALLVYALASASHAIFATERFPQDAVFK